MEKEKKKTIRDILEEVDNFKAIKNDKDITGLEDKIPLVSNPGEEKQPDEISPMESTPPPIGREMMEDPEEEIVEEPIKLMEEPKDNLEEPKTDASRDLDDDLMTTPKTDMYKINKIEDLESRIVSLEEENKKLTSKINSQKSEIDSYLEKMGEIEKENRNLKSELSNVESNVKVNFEAELNKASVIEQKYLELAKTHEEMKARVRRDIRRIGVREKELSNKIELMRNDSETLLKAKDNKILQLKQHIDNLEFEIENLKEKITAAQEQARESEEKAERVVKALRLSTSLLETAKKE